VNVDDKTAERNVDDAPDVKPTEGVENDKAVTETDESPQGKQAPRRKIAVPLKVAPVILVLLLLVSGGLAAWLYFTVYQPDEQTDAAAGQAAVTTAREGTVAILSYKSETLDQDFTTAKSHLTGDFLNTYENFTRQVITPAVKEKAVTTTAQVVGAAASELHPNSAVVMVFVNQTTTSKDRPDPAMSASTVLVSLTKANGRWLIKDFQPV
jgi:Mce-associated membrane protein